MYGFLSGLEAFLSYTLQLYGGNTISYRIPLRYSISLFGAVVLVFRAALGNFLRPLVLCYCNCRHSVSVSQFHFCFGPKHGFSGASSSNTVTLAVNPVRQLGFVCVYVFTGTVTVPFCLHRKATRPVNSKIIQQKQVTQGHYLSRHCTNLTYPLL